MVAAVGSTWKRGRHLLDDDPVRLALPPWLHAVAVANAGLTALVATYVYFGVVVLAIAAVPALTAYALWLATTYGRPVSRRILPLYLATVVALLVHAFEQWAMGYAPTLVRLFPAAFAPPAGLTEGVWLAAFPIGSTVLFLAGGAALFHHHPVGTFVAWLLFVTAVWMPLSHAVLALSAPAGPAYVPGMASAVLPAISGAAGIRGVLRTRLAGRPS